MKVLVTGAKGFIGQNLIAQLELNDNIEITEVTRSNSEDIDKLCRGVDFVFHVAGENRPKDPRDFNKVNVGFTKKLLDRLSDQGRVIPVVFTSSIQATLDNPYGHSKKEAEELVFKYGRATKAPVYVFRLPNVFGKWAQPNYNSVVATFCYDIAHGNPLNIKEPDHLITLVHIDDVVRHLVRCLSNPRLTSKFCEIGPIHQITVERLAETLCEFWDSRQSRVLPDLSNSFNKALYGTLSSYYKLEGLSIKPDVFPDERGWLFELAKSHRDGQIFVSSTKPGYTRGDHWHNTKVEKFTVIKGSGVLLFRLLNSDEIVTYALSDKQIEIVDIPVGYIHAIQNNGDVDMLLIIWASEILDKDNPDTYYEKVRA